MTISLYLSGYNILEMGNIKARQVINSIRKVNKAAILKPSKTPTVAYEEVKKNSELVVKDNVKFEGKFYKLNILKLSNRVKKDKLEKIYLSERELLKSIYDKTPIYEKYIAKDSSSNYKNSEETAVFNKQVEYELSEADKERILTASKKLSPLDLEKINTYLNYVSGINTKNAINLLRDRLSDKDFEKIKDISLKLNNN